MQVRLTADTAIKYVHAYFAKQGEKVTVVQVQSHITDDDYHFMDVTFIRGHNTHTTLELFTVWQREDGSLYGEW